jgi:hypothetical protein
MAMSRPICAQYAKMQRNQVTIARGNGSITDNMSRDQVTIALCDGAFMTDTSAIK